MEKETEAQGSEVTQGAKTSAPVDPRYLPVNIAHKWTLGHKNQPALECEPQMPKDNFQLLPKCVM